jgi:hypothetical protein
VGRQLRSDQTPRRGDVTRFGREGGWIGRFRRGGSAQTPGPLVVVSRVDLFENTDGAAHDLQLYKGAMTAEVGKTARIAKLGDEAVGATSLQGGAVAVRSYVIAWRRQNATGEIEANGFADRFRLADAVALARMQDARLRRAAR